MKGGDKNKVNLPNSEKNAVVWVTFMPSGTLEMDIYRLVYIIKNILDIKGNARDF